jgi:hypothetical protein
MPKKLKDIFLSFAKIKNKKAANKTSAKKEKSNFLFRLKNFNMRFKNDPSLRGGAKRRRGNLVVTQWLHNGIATLARGSLAMTKLILIWGER